MKRINILSEIPNTITLLNMVGGCLAILSATAGNWERAAWFIYAAALMDFFDGLAARALKVSSPIGKDLDSLSDVVSFGVAPAAMMFFYYRELLMTAVPNGFLAYVPLVFLLIPTFSAYRLARFNHDSRQAYGFIGLPTPAFGLLIASLIAGIAPLKPAFALWLLPAVALIGSFLLLANLPLLALKFKDYRYKGNEARMILLAISAILIVLYGYLGISAAIVVYIFFSIFARVK